MAKKMTISEICRLTGLAPHTLRFYEKQFPQLLTPERTAGGHRSYSMTHLEAIWKILKCIREDRMSIRRAQAHLQPDHDPVSDVKTHPGPEVAPTASASNSAPEAVAPILKKLEELTNLYGRLDQVVDSLLEERHQNQRQTLLEQISSLRSENRQMVELLRKISPSSAN